MRGREGEGKRMYSQPEREEDPEKETEVEDREHFKQEDVVPEHML